MINYCGRCNRGWISNSFRDGNSLSGEPCGCDYRTCDHCGSEMTPEEAEESLEIDPETDLCTDCLEEN